MKVSLAFVEHRVNVYLRFGGPVREIKLDRWRRVVVLAPGSVCCRIKWIAKDYGTALWQLMVLQAPMPFGDMQRVAGMSPGTRILLRTDGEQQVKTVLELIDDIEASGIEPLRCSGDLLAHRRTPTGCTTAAAGIHGRTPCGASFTWRAAMTPHMRRSALLACVGVAVVALVLPAMVRVRTRIVYNPSDSVARGWYRITPDVAPDSLHVGSIILTRLSADVAALAAQRGYLPEGVPILKRIGAMAPQSVCVRKQVVRIDGAALATARLHDGAHRWLPAWKQCRNLTKNELFLLSDTNPASFDSR